MQGKYYLYRNAVSPIGGRQLFLLMEYYMQTGAEPFPPEKQREYGGKMSRTYWRKGINTGRAVLYDPI
jgi:hypothetical protein